MAHTNANVPGVLSDFPSNPIPPCLLDSAVPELNGALRQYVDIHDIEHTEKDAPSMPVARNRLPEMSSGVSSLDEWHQYFVNALNEAAASRDYEFGSRYATLVSKAEYAFRQEELWMEEVNFPILQLCQEQHSRVLGALHNVHSRVMAGDLGLGREVVDKLLPRWFAFHASTVDATLALTMQMARVEKAPIADGPTDNYSDDPQTS